MTTEFPAEHPRRQFLKLSATGVALAGTAPALLAWGGTGAQRRPATAVDTSMPTAPSQTSTEALPIPDINETYVESAAAGSMPDLPRRLGWVKFANDPYFDLIASSMRQAGADTDVEIIEGNAEGDLVAAIDLYQQQLIQGVAGLLLLPYNQDAQGPIAEEAIDAGVASIGLTILPSTVAVSSDEEQFGVLMAETVSEFIASQLDGVGRVLLFNEDEVESLRMRYESFRTALADLSPESEIVLDVTPLNTADDGFAQASAAFNSDPTINVILGPGLAILGALAAGEEAGLDPATTFMAAIGGTDGEIAAVKQPDSLLKVSFAASGTMLTYMAVRWTADWLAGRSIPMGVDFRNFVIDSSNVEQFEVDLLDPAAVYDDGRVSEYLGLFGNIAYDTRDAYRTELWMPPA